ncbi:alpha-amylase family glycosyl hydrolase [Piscinibacter sakaiensis]|uniref:alpha-amylase family glycosyl hydrolase n=1 Tax=Piscinibacter sakaiensis TaxID=1547922 RepID=UPI00372D707F
MPDPASRSNPDGVHGPSEVVDPNAFVWQHDGWTGRPWHEAVLYELHVGSFTPEGSFRAAARKLPALAALGITAVELMPLASFGGRRGWGYDGVLPFAPAACYGPPDDLRHFVDRAHGLGLMVLLDVVYNHFGPDGNYLHAHCRSFFDAARRTPWGDALNVDGPRSATVRRFFVDNALHWLTEYRMDGLRLDAVHAIEDRSARHLVDEIAEALHRGPGRHRHVHLVLENDDNRADWLQRDAAGSPRLATAQWNDDWHHAAHVLATGETAGYYADYAADPAADLARALAGGFVYQGQPSAHTTRSATGPSASGSTPWRRPSAWRRCSRPCCSRRRCRCSSWARSSRRARPSPISASSTVRWAGRSRTAAVRSSPASTPSPTRHGGRRCPIRTTRPPSRPPACAGRRPRRPPANAGRRWWPACCGCAALAPEQVQVLWLPPTAPVPKAAATGAAADACALPPT